MLKMQITDFYFMSNHKKLTNLKPDNHKAEKSYIQPFEMGFITMHS